MVKATDSSQNFEPCSSNSRVCAFSRFHEAKTVEDNGEARGDTEAGNNTGRGEHGPQNKTWDTDSYTHMGGKVKPYTLTSSYKQRLSENPL